MTKTRIHKLFVFVERYTPSFVSKLIRSFGTAFLTPVFFSIRSGHFRSSWTNRPVTSTGHPLPWYSYPFIEFLEARSFHDCNILEFGGGQSTLWWAERAAKVVTLEGNESWYEFLKSSAPENVSIFLVPLDSPASCVESVQRILAENDFKSFDVVVIDGLYRAEMIDIALQVISEDGAIIGDTTENEDLFEGFRNKGMFRADFYGYVPGNVQRSCMSIYFNDKSPLFGAMVPISQISTEIESAH